MQTLRLEDRALIEVQGPDRHAFLQGLVTNDVTKNMPQYSALLTPQGKYLFDFFLIPQKESILIECQASRAQELLKKLSLYKLRSNVTLTELLQYAVVLSPTPMKDYISYEDPRFKGFGYRTLYPLPCPILANFEAYLDHRLAFGIPEGGTDIIIDKSIPLECGLDDLHAIDWDKGCYMGQELTARTKYRGLVRKRLVSVKIRGAIGDDKTIFWGDKDVGDLRSHNDILGIAYLRLEALEGPLRVGDALLECISKINQKDSIDLPPTN